MLIIASFNEKHRKTVLALPLKKEVQMEGIVMGYILPDEDAAGIPGNSPIPFEEWWDGRATVYIEDGTFPTISVSEGPSVPPMENPEAMPPPP